MMRTGQGFRRGQRVLVLGQYESTKYFRNWEGTVAAILPPDKDTERPNDPIVEVAFEDAPGQGRYSGRCTVHFYPRDLRVGR